MNTDLDITQLLARIHKAESHRDAWQAAGNREKYLESYCLIESLQAQLEAAGPGRAATDGA